MERRIFVGYGWVGKKSPNLREKRVTVKFSRFTLLYGKSMDLYDLLNTIKQLGLVKKSEKGCRKGTSEIKQEPSNKC